MGCLNLYHIKSEYSSSHVITGQDRSSQFGSSQIKSGQVKSSYDRSSQVLTGQVKLGKVKSDRSSRKFFRPKIFFDTNLFWDQCFLETKILFDPKYL